MSDIQQLFDKFVQHYDANKHDKLWDRQSETFRDFWKSQIIPDRATESDYDPIIRLLDVKARGFNQQTDEAVAAVSLHQGVWYRIFNDLRAKKDIQSIVDEIFGTTDEKKLADLINLLYKANGENKNGLTGRNANALNAMLFINDPRRFVSCVSLNHRRHIIEHFKLGNFDSLKTFGEQVVFSSRMILDGFSAQLEGKWTPRTISRFLYSQPVASQWRLRAEEETPGSEAEEETQVQAKDSEFAIEKHLEDFLVANWEATDLGKNYELIEQEGEILSQQYPTDIGNIDLLVRDRKTGEYVVIELKKGQTSDATVGQLTRYMGWAKKNLAGGKSVRGIIIASGFDPKLKYSVEMVPNATILGYKIHFTLQEL